MTIITKKSDLFYSKPLKIVERKGPSFVLEDYHTWHASKFTSVPHPPASCRQSELDLPSILPLTSGSKEPEV